MLTLLALALGARIVRNDASLDLGADPHDVSEVTKDAEEVARIAEEAVKDVDLAEHGDLSPEDMARIVKEVAPDAAMVKGIVHDVFGKGGLLARAKQGLKSLKDKRKDFCWWKITRRPTVPLPQNEPEEHISCFSKYCKKVTNLFRHKKHLQCPAGRETFKLNEAWCHSRCHGSLPNSCGLACVQKGRLSCTKAVLTDVEAGGRLVLDALAIIVPTPLTIGVGVGVSATLDSLHLVAKMVMAGVDDQDAHVKEAKFAAAMLAVVHHAGDPKNWEELKSSAVAVKDDVHVKEYAHRAFAKFKDSLKDTKSVMHLVYTAFHDSTVLQHIGRLALADTVATGLFTIENVFSAFMAPTCKDA